MVRNIGTDIGTMDMIKMGWLQARLDQRQGDRTLLTGTPEYIDGIAYVVQTDPDLIAREISKFVRQACRRARARRRSPTRPAARPRVRVPLNTMTARFRPSWPSEPRMALQPS